MSGVDDVVWLIVLLSVGSLALAGFSLYFGLRARFEDQSDDIRVLRARYDALSRDMDFLYERVADIDNLVHGRSVLGSSDVASLQRWVDDSLSKVSRIESFLDSLN